ncbi:GNAT family N-acetyltransferase [Chitinophaga sp. Ak27]|uniref:GNAT family N-acetyltransferase n=1 Tax=Chitinophaga sp. Ak27 TaxID=2726116 RepID=UPI00145ED141|nr:GNAT family N-acetyltransferase [Chitinophaga sp. Ak27]NLU94400.1 GNAT family N-acetyltransferase [Chitinophaga sp. Ak27]
MDNSSYACLTKQVYNFDDYTILPLRLIDKQDIMNWRNAQMDVLRQNRVLTIEDQSKYFTNVIAPLFTQEFPQQILFSFLYKNVCIGYGGLVHITWADKRGEISFLLDNNRLSDNEQYRKEFSIFLDFMKKVAFDDLKFNRLFTETYDIRPFHIGVLENNGFLLEGRMKQHIFMNGNFCDSLIHGFLKEYRNV